jgi:hypothetical protein
MMLAIAAAVIFAIAFIINATRTVTDQAFPATELLLPGLACLALHECGVGAGWRVPRRRR